MHCCAFLLFLKLDSFSQPKAGTVCKLAVFQAEQLLYAVTAL